MAVINGLAIAVGVALWMAEGGETRYASVFIGLICGAVAWALTEWSERRQ